MNKAMKRFIYMGVLISILAMSLTIYNKSIENKAIDSATKFAGEVFKAKTDCPKGSNRIIVEKYLRNEEELFELTKNSLPQLSIIGDYNVLELLSFRAYYGKDKSNPQFYDIKFNNIDKINWAEINNFDAFLNEINKFN